tara:strand:+ start:124 stop:465 length:342 start_codon:yes stop_codon:yes gene_type:complete
MIATRLVEDCGMNQQHAAQILGVTQAAISNYLRRTRAIAVNLNDCKEICESVDDVTELLLEGGPNQSEVTEKIVAICEYLRMELMLCDLHKRFEPSYNTDECSACKTSFSIKK